MITQMKVKTLYLIIEIYFEPCTSAHFPNIDAETYQMTFGYSLNVVCVPRDFKTKITNDIENKITGHIKVNGCERFIFKY